MHPADRAIQRARFEAVVFGEGELEVAPREQRTQGRSVGVHGVPDLRIFVYGSYSGLQRMYIGEGATVRAVHIRSPS